MKKILISEDVYNILDDVYEMLDQIEEIEELSDVQTKFATALIHIGRKFELYEHEINFGNVQSDGNELTHIDENGNYKKYKIVNRKAVKGDIVKITTDDEYTPFNKEHAGRFFKVTESGYKSDLVVEHVVVGYNALYHDQYVVLEELLQ